MSAAILVLQGAGSNGVGASAGRERPTRRPPSFAAGIHSAMGSGVMARSHRFPVSSLTAVTLLGSALLSACSSDSSPRRFTEDGGSPEPEFNPVSPIPANPTGAMPNPIGPTSANPSVTPLAPGEGGAPGSGGGTSQAGSPSAGGTPMGGRGSVAVADAGAPPEPVVFGDYSVVCQDRNDGQTEGAQFAVALTLVNNTEEAIPVDEISVRYYFTSDNETNAMLTGHLVFIDDASPTWGARDNVQVEVFELDPPEDGADHYVELSFGTGDCGGAPCLWPPTPAGTEPILEQRPTQLRVQIDPSALRYDLSDDYSYSPDADGQTLCETITLYRNGRLIFGTEPDGSMPVPAADAGVPDAGLPSPDGGTLDGGVEPMLDAGAPDAADASSPVGQPDASTPLDAGAPAVPDAAVEMDSGLGNDAGP